MGQTDINRVMEDVLVPIFKEIFACPNLRNLNTTEYSNFPGIDLGDETTRIAFQVTASSDSDKMKKTLYQFVEHDLYKTYDRLVIYILTEKQRSYSGRGFVDIIQDRFTFNKDTDIWDYTDIAHKVAGINDVGQAQKLLELFEQHVGIGSVPAPIQHPGLQNETVYLNLLYLNFPDTLYIADLAVEQHEIIKNPRLSQSRLQYARSPRSIVQSALGILGLKFGVDWVYHERKVITFHDLSNTDIPLARVIDGGTVTEMRPSDFYRIDDNYNRVFKSLLHHTLRQQLYHRGVQWQNEEKTFIFVGIGNQDKRTITWIGKRKSDRDVFICTRKQDNLDEILQCKHLSFRVQYRQFESDWYAVIEPGWFFSYDGYKKLWNAAENVAWLKRKENSIQVLHHAQAIAYFLSQQPDVDVFGQRQRFLSFGSFATFDNSPLLYDKDWLPVSERKMNNQPELDL